MRRMIEKCEALLEKECGGKTFLVSSCTSALEIACALTLEPGDEVIVPSWGHPANVCAVVRAGGVPVFVDVDENLNITGVEKVLTPKTKAIMPVHYAGVLADDVKPIADKYGLYVIEDAAQAIGNWKVSGDFGCVSFHRTKSVQCGEGGALVVNNLSFIDKVEKYIYWGTDKARYNRGEVPGWEWSSIGSSYAMSSYAAQHLYKELNELERITEKRKAVWRIYESCLNPKSIGNGHLYWFETKDRTLFLDAARRHQIQAGSHFDALHMTAPGRKHGRVGAPITRATKAMNDLVKFNTGVSEQEAIRACTTLFPELTLFA